MHHIAWFQGTDCLTLVSTAHGWLSPVAGKLHQASCLAQRSMLMTLILIDPSTTLHMYLYNRSLQHTLPQLKTVQCDDTR